MDKVCQSIPKRTKSYLSFSLWGEKEIYTIGAVRNAELAKTIYPGWSVIIYYDKSVPHNIIKKLESLDVILIDMSGSLLHPSFWRFLVADIPDCLRVAIRDLDSRLSIREKSAVDEWIQADTAVHAMRDHPFHEIPFGNQQMGILAGMWGIKGGLFNMESKIEAFIKNREQVYGIDQSFLQNIYRDFSNNMTIHDDFFAKKPFPIAREGYRFIGERINIDEQPLGEDWKQIMYYNKKQKRRFSYWWQKFKSVFG